LNSLIDARVPGGQDSPGHANRRYVSRRGLAAYPPRVTIINAQDALGAGISDAAFRKETEYVFRSDKDLGQAGRIQLMWRGPRDPLPIY
jgi:hypothetical protein